MKIKLLILTPILFAILGVFAQQGLPKNVPQTKHFQIENDGWHFDDDNFIKVYLTGSDLDSTGVLDVSGVINAKIAGALISFGKKTVEIVLPKGKFLIKKPIQMVSNVLLSGLGRAETEIICMVGENRNCINFAPAKILPPVVLLLEKSIFKNEFEIWINKDSLENKIDPNSQIFGAVVKYNDSGLITSSWSKNMVKEFFTAMPEGNLVGNEYKIPCSVIDRSNIKIMYYKDPKKHFSLNYDKDPKNTGVEIYEMIKNAGIKCFSIIRKDTTATQTSNINMNFAYNCFVKAVVSKQCNFGHITLNNSFYNLIKRNQISLANGYGGGGKGYGVCLQSGSSSNTVYDNVFSTLRHSILFQSGANNNVVLGNFSTNPFWTEGAFPNDAAGDLVLHGNYPFANLVEFNYVNQIVIDDSHGKNGPYNIFHRNYITNYGIAMSAANGSDSQLFSGNEVTNKGFIKGLFVLQDKGHFLYGNKIKNTVQPNNTSNDLVFSISKNNLKNQFNFKRLSVPFFPAIINEEIPPFGFPFTGTKTIEAKERDMDFPQCFVYYQDTISYTLGIENAANNSFALICSPNPNNGKFRVNKLGRLEIFNSRGQKVSTVIISSPEMEIEIKTAGIYFLKMDNGLQISVGKVIVE